MDLVTGCRRPGTVLVLVALALAATLLSGCSSSDGAGGSGASSSRPPSPAGDALDVRSLGATGDGQADDWQAVQEAVRQAAATGRAVSLPPGTYLCTRPVELPDGVSVQGAGESSWLKGQLVFASANDVGGLKIGDAGRAAVVNADGARGTVFRDCRFRGGGDTEGGESSVVFLGGSHGSVSGLLFERCRFERTLYEPPPGVDAYEANVGNTISIHEYSYDHDAAHVEDVTFRDCHLGASNGRAKGALRMMLEAFCWDERTGRVLHGWRDLTFDGCIIEAADSNGLDFADRPLSSDPSRRAASGVLITGCTFLGAGVGRGGPAIVYECPTGIVIRDNVFYASPGDVIGGSHSFQSDAPRLVIEGNTFDMTRNPAGFEHLPGEPIISLIGHGSRIEGNTFLYDTGIGVRIKAGSGDSVYGATGNVIRGNTFKDTRLSNGEPTIVLLDEYGLGCFDNSITANTIENRAAGRAGVIVHDTGDGANRAVGNTIDAGSSAPFVVLSGRFVQRDNHVQGQR